MLNHLRKPHLIRQYVFAFITMFMTFSCAQIKDHDHHTTTDISVLPEYVFSPSADITTQVTQTLALAKAQNKKALLVLGAQWCHDSKSLAKNFSTPAMQAILAQHYQVLFIDVGYLEQDFELVQTFELPAYYGTPTVMIIEPNEAKVVNKNTMKKWLSADKVPLIEYVDYFNAMASKSIAAAELDQIMLNYLRQINDFEQQQANRLKAAYGIIGPLLKQYMESDRKEASTEFNDKWQQVYTLRSKIPDDVQALIKQAKDNVKLGSSAKLTLPTYPAFTWE